MKKFPPPSHRSIPTRDKKQKREPMAESKRHGRERKKGDEQKLEDAQRMRTQAARQGLVAIDRSKLRSHSVMPSSRVPSLGGKYYLDYKFTCKDCGAQDIWTGRQQKWWHEEMGGDVESTAVRCRDCRIKERVRREAARRSRDEGMARKQLERAALSHLKSRKRKRSGPL